MNREACRFDLAKRSILTIIAIGATFALFSTVPLARAARFFVKTRLARRPPLPGIERLFQTRSSRQSAFRIKVLPACGITIFSRGGEQEVRL